MSESLLNICIIGDTGGVHVRTRALAFSKRGHTINTVTPRLCGIEELHEKSPRKTSDTGTATYMLECYQLLRECPGDIVHVHYACNLSAWLWLILGSDKSLIVSVMGGDVLFDEQGNLPQTARWMTRQVLHRADAITSETDYLARALTSMGIPGDKIETVLWGIDPEHFKPCESTTLRNELGLSPSHRVIFSPRILRPFYNIHLIIEALAHVLSITPNVRLIICEYEADPSYREQLLSEAKKLGLKDALIFCDYISRDRMPEYYSLADVVVGVPPSDGFPQTLLEAMACKTPNVVTRLDRYKDLVHDRASAIFVDLTPESIAQGILSVLEDGELAECLSNAGRDIVLKKAIFADSVAHMEVIYRRIAEKRSRTPASLWVRAACLFILGGLVLRNIFRRRPTLRK